MRIIRIVTAVLFIVLLLLFSVLFNRAIIVLRLDEINTLLSQATLDAHTANSYSILSRYELIKRRIEHGESDLQSYELESRLHAALQSDSLSVNESKQANSLMDQFTRQFLNGMRFLMGKEPLTTSNQTVSLRELEKAYQYERERQYTNAISLYDALLNGEDLPSRTHRSVLMHKAFCLSMTGNISKSIDTYEIIINKYPDSEEYFIAERIIPFLTQLKESTTASIQTEKKSTVSKGVTLFRSMNYSSAISTLSTYLDTVSKSVEKEPVSEARFFKGRSHEELGDITAATSEYKSIIDMGVANRWSREANRRIVILGDIYQHKNKLTVKAKADLYKSGDSTFVKRIEKTQKIIQPKKKETLSEGKVVPVTVSEAISLEFIREQDSLERKEREIQEKERLRQEKIEEEKRLEQQKQDEIKRKELLAQTEYRNAEFLKSQIQNQYGSIKELYLRYLDNGDNVSGKVIVELTIEASGDVSLKYRDNSIENRRFLRELKRDIESWRFPEVSEELGELTISFPVTFQ